MSNFILPISTIAFSVFFLFFSLSLPKAAEGLGPGAWPTAVLTGMLILGTVLLVRTWKEEKSKKGQEAAPAEATCLKAEEQRPETEHCLPYRHWVVAGILFLYFFIMQYLGMAVSTVFFIIVMGKTLGMRGWVKLTAIALISTACFIALFAKVLTLSLPAGVGVFRAFSSLLY